MGKTEIRDSVKFITETTDTDTFTATMLINYWDAMLTNFSKEI